MKPPSTYLVWLAEVGDSPPHGLVPLGKQPRHVPQPSLRVVDGYVGVDVVHWQVPIDRRLGVQESSAVCFGGAYLNYMNNVASGKQGGRGVELKLTRRNGSRELPLNGL